MGRRADHFTREELDLFLRQELPSSGFCAIVRHLLSGCPLCLSLAREVVLPDSSLEEAAYDAMFRRLDIVFGFAEIEIASERERADSLWAGLRARSLEQRLLFVQNDTRYQFWGLYERALDESQRVLRHHPPTAADLAALALAIVDHLDSRTYGEYRVHDFRAAALIALANAKRLIPDFAGCGEALETANLELQMGTGDPLEQVHLLSVRGSYLTDLGKPEAAVSIMDRARVCCRRVGDRHREGRIVLQQASSIGETDPRRAIRLARQALELLDLAAEPYLALGAWHVLAFGLSFLGEIQEAERIVEANRKLYAQFLDPVMRGRLYRLEAWIARQKGNLLKAEHLFREQRALYIGRGLDFDLVLASVELAEVLTLQHRLSETLDILAETYPIVESWGVPVEVLRSWTRVEKNVAAHAAGTQSFRDLVELLRRNWKRR